jgi:hypothetical protein
MKRYFHLLRMKKRFGKKKKQIGNYLEPRKDYPLKWIGPYLKTFNMYSKRHHIVRFQ